MLKRKSEFPLHRAIQAEREDVVFLYLIEFNSSLDIRINQPNDQGINLEELKVSLHILISKGLTEQKPSRQRVS